MATKLLGVAAIVFAVLFLGAATAKTTVTTLRLELFVSDVPKSVAFYRDVLGFEIERESGNYVALRSGATRLALNQASELPKKHYFNPELQNVRRGLGVEIVLEVDDLDTHYQQVKTSGYPVLESPRKRPWGLTDYRLADPDGYYVRVSSNH